VKPRERNYLINEAAEMLHVHRNTIKRWIREGLLDVSSYRGRTRYVSRADVDFLAAGGSPDDLLRRKMRGA
jgi:excisionase family DNA binding protein